MRRRGRRVYQPGPSVTSRRSRLKEAR